MSGARRCIPAVLVYLEHEGRVLLIHKRRPGDVHSGKYNGLGGKLDADESPVEAAVREVREEAGINVMPGQLRWLGVIQFPLFKMSLAGEVPEDWWVVVFKGELDKTQAAAVAPECEEGTLDWMDWERVPDLPMWEGDALFLPRVRAGRSFNGTIWYRDGRVVRHSLSERAVT